ncbi:MAG TPA: pyrrolo-quinoline quinone [Acidobacteria bacterium]|uniref:Pyrrolo-quinoline quinone repeat domain-containing protein n=1 Tax=marine metagenome TaxID=408172 RepID=A0A381S849_9ZZZZ|nr:pyrrolo-quinoline quinone [Acidobacteriota bacterium]
MALQTVSPLVRTTLIFGVLAGCVLPLSANDWPEWRGVNRDGVWSETGIVDAMPNELNVKWRVPINSGFSGAAVADGRVFITDWAEDPTSRTMDGTERAIALDEETGEILWVREWPTTYRMLMISYAIGPRATPTVDGDRVYVVGATGDLYCLNVETGAVLWEKHYIADYDSFIPTWGVASSPIVDGDRLITVVGGEPGGLIMAFDKRTGAEVWRALDVVGEMGYGQPILVDAGGARQLIVWHAAALVSLNPETGDLYWEEEWEAGGGMSVATPVHSGNYLLVTQFYRGSLMMRLDQDRPDATLLWKGQSRSEMPGETDGLHALITTPLIEGDHIYGVGSYGELRGLNARTGERVWMSDQMTAQARWGTAFMVKQGDRYFVVNDDGFLIIAEFTPGGYVEQGRTKLIEPTGDAGFGPTRRFDRKVNWSHPAFANGHIVHRNDNEIIRVSLRAEDY